MNLGPAEILVILVLALIVFGPKRLPEVGRQVGAAMRELRRMQESVKSELDGVLHADAAPDAIEEPDHTALPAPARLDSPTVDSLTVDSPTFDEHREPNEPDGFASPGSFS